MENILIALVGVILSIVIWIIKEKELESIQKNYNKSLQNIKKIYDDGLIEIKKVYHDELSKVIKNINDETQLQIKNAETNNEQKWDLHFLNACRQDHEFLKDKFTMGWDMTILVNELNIAVKDYVTALNNQQPLKTKVARIANLLFLYSLSKEDEKKNQLKNLRLKNMN